MTRRLPTAERREQIVLATLDLLSRHPVSDVTTRLIAEEVGLSQPALFRHFDTRSALFAAVIAHSRDRLRDGADRALAGAPTWDDAAQAIAAVIVEHAGAHPGLPRLYFYDLAASDGAEAHRSLNGLADMQAGLMASLVRQGQQAGDVPPTVDADTAGRVRPHFRRRAVGSGAISEAS